MRPAHGKAEPDAIVMFLVASIVAALVAIVVG